ncbi:hypothetical protein [Kitasatospora sp. A2-31]|uniref:hypothetical protein n=1 Tax=Kitasatospora sp. A2-31 TaxID=2916414 RepID=UPI001EEEF626|nr:hypothetical protein [Kitasatospora sp. A2-31]MCG6499443.1 hypothetical protein [Kitasatospora sp. A2-31]
MGLWSKLTGGQTAETTPTRRTLADRRRREREIRRIDKGTAAWLAAGGRGRRTDR